MNLAFVATKYSDTLSLYYLKLLQSRLLRWLVYVV